MNSFGPKQSVDEKYHLIQNELVRSNIRPDLLLTKAEFLQFLDDRISGRTFNREIAMQLYDRMSKNMNGDITIDEFIKVYIEAQDFLVQNLTQTQQNLQEYMNQRTNALQKLEELKDIEVQNEFGVMENSILTAQVLDIREINRASFRNVYVVVSCGENTFQTTALPYSDGMEFNEQFNIDIKTGMEIVQVVVVAIGANNKAEALGEILIQVRDLSDQLFRDEVYDLLDSNGNLAGGQIHLKLQWIHSRVKYLETVIRKWEENIQVQTEDKEDFEQSLAALAQLFPRLKFDLPIFKDSHNQDSILQDNYLKDSPGQKKVMRSGPKDSIPTAQFVQENPQIAPPGTPNDLVIEWQESSFWGQMSFQGTLGLLILTMLSFLMKPGEIKLILCFSFLKDYDLKRKYRGSVDGMKLNLGLLVGAILYDFVWLILYTGGWGGTVLGWEPKSGTLIFVLVIEYFSFMIKLGLLLCYYNFFLLVKDKNAKAVQVGAKPT